MDMKREDTWKKEILRIIYGPVAEQEIWKIRTNQELRELYKDLDKVVVDIKKERLEWIGHVARKNQERTVKYLRANRREIEAEDLDKDGWKMWRRI
jgi:hypothetical protein